jgi:hypothetical protein
MRRASDPLLAGLVDDAALFPPGNAPMDVALAEHAGLRAAAWSAAVGPFLCPAARIDELVAALPADQHIRLAIVVDTPPDGAELALRNATADRRITLVAVEAALARLGADADAVGKDLKQVAGVTGFLEVPRTGFDAGLGLVAGSGWHAAKYRTGGITAEAFPSERELAAFLVAVTALDLPFKLTAGLHHAVRHTTDEGFEAHGVLNVLVATRVATTGAAAGDVAMVLAQREPAPLVELVGSWDDRTAAAARRAFRSFGCCGVREPIDELRALGVLEDDGDDL